MWSDEGLGEFSSTGFKMPASNKSAKQAAANIFNEVERQSNARGPLTPALKESLRNKLDNNIGSKENLLSFIADNQFEIFKFDDLDPESDISELRETVLDRLMNGLESTRGSALAKPAGDRGNGSQSASMQEATASWNNAKNAWSSSNMFSLKTANGEKLTFKPTATANKWDVFVTNSKGVATLYQGGKRVNSLDEVQALFGYKF